MANLTETSTYDAGVYQLETTDPVAGGAAGISNTPLKNLANRTNYLKAHVDALEAGTTVPPTVATLASPTFTGDPKGPTAAAGDNDTSLATTAFVRQAVSGYLSKSVAGGVNVTLTAIEAGNAILEFTGALTASIAVIVPTTPTGVWVVKNSTSGTFTLTVKTAAGTGILVPQGTVTEVYGDGTNVVSSVSSLVNLTTTGNTVLGDSSTDTLNVGNGGLVKDSAGKVGIGSAAPTDKLSVFGNGASLNSGAGTASTPGDVAAPWLAWRATDASVRAYISHGTETAGGLSDEFRLFQQYGFKTFYTSGVERMRISPDGNVGIGTASPVTAFSIKTKYAFSANDNGAIRIDGEAASSGVGTIDQIGGLNLRSGSRYYGSGFSTPEASATAQYSMDTSGNHVWYTNNGLTSGVNYTPAERMRMNAAGIVGIGLAPVPISSTSAFPARLQVQESATDFAGVDVRSFQAGGSINRGYTTTLLQGSGGNINGTGNVSIRMHHNDTIDLSGDMSFWTKSSSVPALERMRISAAGLVGIGTNGPGAKLQINSNSLNEAVPLLINDTRGDTVSSASLVFQRQGVTVGNISTTTSATSYNTTSDRRLKKSIADALDAGADIDAIQVRSFDWLADNVHQEYGVIAQELAEVAPYAVCQPTDPEEMMSVDYSKLVPLLIKEVQSLRARIATLEHT